ncbi:hypothetical protein BO78DRAFT_393038 [Aspergillus sclerotiicarbonarius CBS 121057]|uniref:Zn(2)-C6 fungal-type domain-containing protein n=1 Tax=Aspergillus sclerotiicarbonarius (strain CBS 121057 / IBT 28362) TaxID=1448318 RepID=A0A319EPS4_ASPSB|nr:hypothetical protein BO78DRAFT_393038 [Aspergillus sclerotiicarbonarius CBS 121057]
MNRVTPQTESEPASRTTKSFRRHACDRCRSQKLRCDRCARNQWTCVTEAPMAMSRPRSLHPNPRHRKSSKAMDGPRSKATRADSMPPSGTTHIAGRDAMDELPELVFDQADLNYDFGLDLNVFDSSAVADLAMESQPDAAETTENTTVNLQEQNIERLWKLHSMLLENVYRIESRVTVRPDTTNDTSGEPHPLGCTQSDHPIHQMMRCS